MFQWPPAWYQQFLKVELWLPFKHSVRHHCDWTRGHQKLNAFINREVEGRHNHNMFLLQLIHFNLYQREIHDLYVVLQGCRWSQLHDLAVCYCNTRTRASHDAWLIKVKVTTGMCQISSHNVQKKICIRWN